MKNLTNRVWCFLGGLAIVALLGGCDGDQVIGTPIAPEDMSKIKAGMTLAEIEAILGPGRAASSEQSGRLDAMLAQIPAEAHVARKDGDTDLAWGMPDRWLAARISAEKRAYLVTSQFGGAPPPPPDGEPKFLFRAPGFPQPKS
ncbi:MAG: hypothetical protein FJ276_00495 [Planctomycetes bacterium]|nr:hypothetical protein [Planctomycetota bacterium]